MPVDYKSPEYNAWRGIKQRCYNKKNKKYYRYGGRGIRVCDRWMQSYEDFYEDMGPRPSDLHSIDRIDNDGDYEPNNCRWAAKLEQMENCSNTRRIEVDGELLPLRKAAEKLQMELNVLRERIKRNKKDRDLTVPLLQKKLYTYDGLTLSVHAWSKRKGMPYFTLWNRLRKGMSIDEALNKVSRNEPRTYNGATRSLTDWAKIAGLNLGTLKDRLRNGWEFGDAISTPTMSTGRPKRLEPFGIGPRT